MKRHWSWILARTLFGVSAAMLVPIIVLAYANRHAPSVWEVSDPAQIGVALVFSIVGALLATRQPGHPIGWLFITVGLANQVSSVTAQWAVYGLETRTGTPGAALALWASLWFAALGLTLPAALPLLLFPSGRLSSWPVRIVAWVSGGATIMLLVGLMSGNFAPPGFPELYERTPNPLALSQPIINPGIAIQILALCGVISVIVLLTRFRTSRGDTRQQYKWVVVAMAFVVVGFIADFVARSNETSWHIVTEPLLGVAFALMPAMMIVAILRYRLWDIDLIISNALVYGVLTASLFATYLALILALGSLGRAIAGYDSTVGVAISTLAVAALVRPLRGRIQGVVDRRFYRRRYDAARMIEQFSARLRDDVDLNAVNRDLQHIVIETMQPAHVSLWLRSIDGERS